MKKISTCCCGAWRAACAVAHIPAVAVLLNLLLIVVILFFFNDTFETALLLVIPVALAGWLLGWHLGSLFGLFAAVLLAPTFGRYTSLISPPLEPYTWLALGASYIVFGLLIGLQGATCATAAGNTPKSRRNCATPRNRWSITNRLSAI